MQPVSQHLLDTLALAKPLLLKISASEAAQKPAPNKWSKKEIIGHLCDSACNNQQKFVRTMLAPSGHFDFIGYEQDVWVATQRYQHQNWRALLRFWDSYNRQLALLIAQVPPEKLSHTISIEGHGPYRLDFIMTDYVEHLRHHLRAVLPGAGITSQFGNVYGA